ncbi:hypothetical protein BDV11DRAFT_122349 [Aspergillus similis]
MDEYSTGGGGKLKLKGSKVSDGRVKKKSKKSSSAGTRATTGTGEKVEGKRSEDAVAEERARSVSGGAEGEDGSYSTGTSTPTQPAKTEAERKHEEMKRKRVQERLKREGVKTHKERVEELNKYLSRLSEHHDMPKIGPG